VIPRLIGLDSATSGITHLHLEEEEGGTTTEPVSTAVSDEPDRR